MPIEEIMWTEKYRPRRLDDIVNQKSIITALKRFIAEKNVPHMLFAGPAGVGKTATALAFAYELYGENWRQNTLELNASDERGINVVRERIKEYFAKTLPIGEAPFRLVILDESDAMTADAQTALRRIMEIYARNVRFILTCNYSYKIIEPIQSRTVIFRFNPLKKEDVIGRLKFIAENEGVSVSEDAYEAIWDLCGGDLRKAINILQSAAALGNVTSDTVYRVAGVARPKEIRLMLEKALKGDFNGARTDLYKLMFTYGLSGIDIVSQMYREIMRLEGGSERLKMKLLEILGDYEFRLVEGANDDIQLTALLARIALLGSKGV